MRTQWTDYQSPLAAWIKRYLAYKRALRRRFDNEETVLRLLDRYLEGLPYHFSRRLYDEYTHLRSRFIQLF